MVWMTRCSPLCSVLHCVVLLKMEQQARGFMLPNSSEAASSEDEYDGWDAYGSIVDGALVGAHKYCPRAGVLGHFILTLTHVLLSGL